MEIIPIVIMVGVAWFTVASVVATVGCRIASSGEDDYQLAVLRREIVAQRHYAADAPLSTHPRS